MRPPAFFPFKVTVIEGWRHAILTFIIRRRKRSASFWMLTGASGRGAPRCHITFFFNIFRDALINNSFNLQYVIITPPPPYEMTDSEEIKLSFPLQKGLNGGPRELGRNQLHEKEILFLHWGSLVQRGDWKWSGARSGRAWNTMSGGWALSGGYGKPQMSHKQEYFFICLRWVLVVARGTLAVSCGILRCCAWIL